MSASLLFKTMWRQARGARGRLVFFVACIAVGVAAVVGVAALVDVVELGVRTRSREMLGGDLSIESRRAASRRSAKAFCASARTCTRSPTACTRAS